jgi:membrane-associated protease RseP (regulator of RpoE activity)
MIRPLLALALLAHVAHADDPKYACKEPAPDTKIVAYFKADASLKDLTAWALGFTCKAIVFDASIPQDVPKVMIATPKPLTPKQALALFVDAIQATGLVVEVKPDTIIIKRGPNTPQKCPDVATATPPASDPAADELAAQIDKGIVVVDETHRRIDKLLVDKVLANPMAIAKGARVVPAMKDGKPRGFKLYAIRPSSIYAKLGLANGDTLVRINGFDLTSADKALEVYTKIREATSLEVEIERRGKPMTFYYTIK